MSIIYNGQTVAGVYAEQILNNADTINAGIIKIATQEEVDAGENNTSAVTPLYLSNKQNKLESGDNISIENDIISCDIKPDVSTIIQNEDGTLTNVGQLTKSGTIKIDWEGTEAEYTRAMLNGEIDPNWYCYITDDESLVDYADVANQSLSNLRPDGEARFDAKLDKNQITNCLLEVPQNIKLELADGVLTLKAGSKVIVPNGAGVFDEVVIKNDVIKSPTIEGTHTRMVVYNVTSKSFEVLATHYSGATEPTATNSFFWYDTANNKVKIYRDGVVTTNVLTLPIAIVTAGNGFLFNSLEQVFNGFGYIGSHFWVDKGVKALAPNGRNTNGTLKNYEITTTQVSIFTRNLNGDVSLWLNTNGTMALSAGIAYDEKRNVIYSIGVENQTSVRCQVAMTNLTNGVVNSFNPKQPFRAVDWNDFDTYTKTESDSRYVNVSGDTMTGNLVLNKNSGMVNIVGTGYKGIITKSTDIDYTLTDQVSLQGARILSQDKNGQWFGYWQNGIGSAGNVFTGMSARRVIDGTSKECAINCNVNTSGGVYTSAPTPPTGDNSTKIATTAYCVNMRCTTKATTTSSASTTRPAWIVQNYVNGTSWYRVWSDGWIEQGGSPNYGGNTSTTVTFLKAFSNTNYTITVAHARGSGWTNGANANFYDKTAKTVAIYQCDGTGVSWYACGY